MSFCTSSHQTNSAHSGQHTGGAASCCIQTLFPKEKVQLVIILFCAIWNFLNFYKHRLYEKKNIIKVSGKT